MGHLGSHTRGDRPSVAPDQEHGVKCCGIWQCRAAASPPTPASSPTAHNQNGRVLEAWRLARDCGLFGDCGPRRVAASTARVGLNLQLATSEAQHLTAKKRKRDCLSATAPVFTMPSSPAATAGLAQDTALALATTTPKPKRKVMHKGVRARARSSLFDGGSPGSFSSTQPQHTHETIISEPEAGIVQVHCDDSTTYATKIRDLTASTAPAPPKEVRTFKGEFDQESVGKDVAPPAPQEPSKAARTLIESDPPSRKERHNKTASGFPLGDFVWSPWTKEPQVQKGGIKKSAPTPGREMGEREAQKETKRVRRHREGKWESGRTKRVHSHRGWRRRKSPIPTKPKRHQRRSFLFPPCLR
jgi:hypothetical protein